MNFRCKFRHRRSFPYRVRNFRDLATFSFIFAFYMLKVRHISTSGLSDPLTYKVYYRHRLHSHSDKFHQVWSWYDHPLQSYSVLAADSLRHLVTLTFDLLTFNSCHTWQVTWSTLPPRSQTLRLFFRELWVIMSSLKMHMPPLSMRRITWSVSTDLKIISFGIPDPDLPIHYTTFIGLWRRLRVVYFRAVQG